MLKDVIIDFKSDNLSGVDGEGELEFSTEGYYTYEDEVGCVSYEETDVTGMDGTRTSMFIMPDRIVVDRDGPVTSRMIFKPGEKNEFLYQTPFGRAVMEIDTKSIKHDFGLFGGTAVVDYVVNVEHTVFSKNRFTINVKESGDSIHA